MDPGGSGANSFKAIHRGTGCKASHVANPHDDSLYIYKNFSAASLETDSLSGMGDLQVQRISIILKGARESMSERTSSADDRREWPSKNGATALVCVALLITHTKIPNAH